jgi:hypothetical protein
MQSIWICLYQLRGSAQFPPRIDCNGGAELVAIQVIGKFRVVAAYIIIEGGKALWASLWL